MTRAKPWYQLFLRLGGLWPSLALVHGAGYLASVWDSGAWTNLVIALIWTGITGLMVLRSCVSALRAVIVRDFGLVRRAEVTGILRGGPLNTMVKVSGGRAYAWERAWIVWRDDAGDVGQSLAQSAMFAERIPVGHAITVFVDPKRSGVSFWEGDVGLRS